MGDGKHATTDSSQDESAVVHAAGSPTTARPAPGTVPDPAVWAADEAPQGAGDQQSDQQSLSDATGAGLLWGVGAVATRLDIARPTLRTWDRRYGLGPSLRTAGGHRRYSESDVARVRMMSRLLSEGVPAAEAADIALKADDEAIHALGRTTSASGQRASSAPRQASGVVEQLVRAARDLDSDTLARTVNGQLSRRGAVEAWVSVLLPFLREVGERWAAGDLGVESEHLASGVLAAEMRAHSVSHRGRRSVRPRVLLACAEDEQHSLPIFALEASLAERRVPTIVLGQRLPLTALRRAVESRTPSVVFVWASLTQSRADIEWVRSVTTDSAAVVLLGGPGWPSDLQGADEGVELVHDLPSALERVEQVLQTVPDA